MGSGRAEIKSTQNSRSENTQINQFLFNKTVKNSNVKPRKLKGGVLPIETFFDKKNFKFIRKINLNRSLYWFGQLLRLKNKNEIGKY
jgi:hypothetical protein